MKRAILFICIAAVAGAALSLYLFRDRIFPAADFEINDELGGNIFPSLILSSNDRKYLPLPNNFYRK